MDFEINFYKDKSGKNLIKDFLDNLLKSNHLLAIKTAQAIERIKNRTYHKEPFSKYLEPGLWELRVISKNDILRIIYTFRKGKIIILLHIFVKKQQKAPRHDIEMALARLKEIEERSLL